MTTCPKTDQPCYNSECGKTTLICDPYHFQFEKTLKEENQKILNTFELVLNTKNKVINQLIEEIERLKKEKEEMRFAIVRWHENMREDVVCVDREAADNYVKQYNDLAGKEECYVDEDIWLPSGRKK